MHRRLGRYADRLIEAAHVIEHVSAIADKSTTTVSSLAPNWRCGPAHHALDVVFQPCPGESRRKPNGGPLQCGHVRSGVSGRRLEPGLLEGLD
jgi:hypothetical protein